MAKEISPRFKKGTKIFCRKCEAHVATFSKDAFFGEMIGESNFSIEGQGPWLNGENAKCRKCDWDWLGVIFDWKL